jgi:flagellar motility protein MotE (MotC chaperone)
MTSSKRLDQVVRTVHRLPPDELASLLEQAPDWLREMIVQSMERRPFQKP